MRNPSATPIDRRIRTQSDLTRLSFDPESGLLPVVAQDADSGDVLMVAWASQTSLEMTLESGRMTYWSRSRNELWEKGGTSGNTQELVSLHSDCDGDTVLARVRPAGPACHTGEATCFGAGALAGGEVGAETTLPMLWTTLEKRAAQRPEGSYTVRLLNDENLRTKKLGEETAELILALLRTEVGDTESGRTSRGRAAEEAADLIYHMFAALLAAGVSLEDVLGVLERRG